LEAQTVMQCWVIVVLTLRAHNAACLLSFLSVAQHPKSGLGHLSLWVPRSHTITQTHTHPDGLSERVIRSSQRPLPTRQTTNKRRTSLPSDAFESAFPAIKQLQNYALDCSATRIGLLPFSSEYFISLKPLH
jgi:hypothetical protein